MKTLTPIRSLRLAALIVLFTMLLSGVLAQETPAPASTEPTEISTETPAATSEVILTETPVEPATATPETPAASPSPDETATEIPAETETLVTASPEVPVSPSAEPSEEVILPPVAPAALPPEPPLSLLLREMFEAQPAAQWVIFPAGWIPVPAADGTAMQISAVQAGTNSRVALSGSYGNAVVMGYFTFTDNTGRVQFIVRESTAGAYMVTLDAAGNVSLEKRDAAGTTILGAAFLPAAITGTARSLRLSAIGGVLRVAVDNAENLIAVEDVTPLLPGTISAGVIFPAVDAGQPLSGTILLDNVFLWVPAAEAALYQQPTAQPTVEAILPAVETGSQAAAITPTPTNVNGKSTIPQTPPPSWWG